MIRSLQGIPFTVHSPSHFELVSDRVERVHIVFDIRRWALCYMAADGHTITRDFPSRDAAIGLIASRI